LRCDAVLSETDRVGWNIRLQSCQGLGDFVSDDVRAHAQRLAELDPGGAELGQSRSQPCTGIEAHELRIGEASSPSDALPLDAQLPCRAFGDAIAGEDFEDRPGPGRVLAECSHLPVADMCSLKSDSRRSRAWMAVYSNPKGRFCANVAGTAAGPSLTPAHQLSAASQSPRRRLRGLGRRWARVLR